MWLLAPTRLVVRSIRRFRAEHCVQTAAALSFSTLLGLVPMIMAGIGIISFFPEGIGLSKALEKFLLANLLPEKAGGTIAKYVGQFVVRAEKLTFFGILVFSATAVMQMLTIERAFNRIWHIKKDRPFIQRLILHALTLTLGPLFFGASLAVISLVLSASFGLIDEPAWVQFFVMRSALPFVFMAVLFALLYWRVPNKQVNPWQALSGGVLSACGLIGVQKVFTFYLASFTATTVVYGAFSIMPVFLLWLHASWSVILFGAIWAAEMPKSVRG
ncbi:MAG: YihY family inner membrane protein [Rhodocyclales bacterium]|nr:YihY family inner membrane protein [Rhodocyclales bacterium]